MLSNQSHSSSTENKSPLISTRDVNFKTPARSLKHGRVVHNENSVYGHPKMVGFTGKKNNNVLFSTPAGNGPLKPRLKTDKATRFTSKSTALAEITNQTPFTKGLVPVTPAFTKPSISFAIFNDEATALSTRRISSTRKKMRLPRSASNKFETPETKGNYWDVSDTSIEASVIDDGSITEEDYGDVEYASPTAIESKFDPGFNMPNYKEVGATLMSLFRQTTISNDYGPVSGFDGADLLKDIGPLVWEKLELPDISLNDIFTLMTPSESAQGPITAAHMSKMEFSHSKSTEARSAMPFKSSTSRQFATNPLSKPRTGKMTHTRIPSLSRPKVAQAQAATQTTWLNSKATMLGHARTSSVPLKTTNVTHKRTGSVQSNNTTDPKAAIMSSTNGLSKPVRMFIPPPAEWKPEMRSQQTIVPDDTVLSLLTDFENEPLGGEFLFTL